MTPCGEGRVTTRSYEGLVQAGSTFPGRKRIVKSNTESNRVESEGPESAVPHIVAHGRARPQVARLAERERRMLAAASCIYVCFMSACILHSRRCHILEFFLSHCFFPRQLLIPSSLSPRRTPRASFLLIKSRPPRLPPFVFSIFSSVPPALRKSQDKRQCVQRTRKSECSHRKRGTQRGKRITI